MLLVDSHKAGFNVVTFVPWEHLWYVEGPDSVAAGPVDGVALHPVPNDGLSVRALGNDTVGNRPLYEATSDLNGQPALRFDGADFLVSNYTGGNDWSAISQPYTIVIIYKMASVSQGTIDALFGSRVGTNRHDVFSNTAATPDSFTLQGSAAVSVTTPAFDTNPHLLIATWDTTDTLELDGTQIASGDSGAHTSISMHWGALQALFPAAMDSPLLGLLPRAMTAPEKAALRAWSQAKYGTA